MRRWRYGPMVTRAVLCLILGVSCAVAGFVVCPKCGYENQTGSAVCSHCKEKIETTNVPAALDGTDKDAAPGKPIDQAAPKLVNQDLDAIVEYLKSGNFWIALFFCENATALNMISAPDKDREDRLLRLRQDCDKGSRNAERTCPVCKGTGEVGKVLELSSDKGEVVFDKAPTGACEKCDGKGRLPGRLTLAGVKQEYANAMREYTALRQTSRWIPVGSAWIPQSLDRRLTARQLAMLKRATGARCRECLGLSEVPCPKCSGVGKVKCTKCDGGFVTKKMPSAFTGKGSGGWRDKHVMRVRCEECGGTSWTMCAECRGRAILACKACNGMGQRPVCRKCSGEGIVACTRCKGKGELKSQPCTNCDGCGMTLCAGCNGDGRSAESQR